MLRIEHLTASIDGKSILNGVDLEIRPGEVHAIMGPNGAGKSTLSNVLAGRDGYAVTGTVSLDGLDLLALTPEERAVAGLFLAFQYPIEIPGVGNMYFLRTALNAVRRERALPEISAVDFISMAKEHMARLDMDPAFLSRSVNEGFSGGEKKRNEILRCRCSSRASRSSTRPTPGSTSTPSGWWRKVSRPSAPPSAPCSSSRTTPACSTTCGPIMCTC